MLCGKDEMPEPRESEKGSEFISMRVMNRERKGGRSDKERRKERNVENGRESE